MTKISIPDASSPGGESLLDGLRRIYARRDPPVPWADGGNLPWNDAGFSERMLRQHLDQGHGAASRPVREIRAQVDTLMEWLDLRPGSRLLDVTCGPGLYAAEFAGRGVHVTGIDFGPASIDYARRKCAGLACEFVLGDVREMSWPAGWFDAAIYLYGQFTVLKPDESRDVLQRISNALRPGGRLLLEVLDESRFDKQNSNWWYTDRGGLWGDFPYLHLGERAWDPIQKAAVERFHIVNLDSGEVRAYGLSDQTYCIEEMHELLEGAGLTPTATCPGWAGLPLKDAGEWVVYVGERAD